MAVLISERYGRRQSRNPNLAPNMPRQSSFFGKPPNSCTCIDATSFDVLAVPPKQFLAKKIERTGGAASADDCAIEASTPVNVHHVVPDRRAGVVANSMYLSNRYKLDDWVR